MKIVFGSTTLVDDTASPRIAGVIERLGFRALVQTETLYGAANEIDFPRGNVGGELVFTAGCSFASYSAAADAFKAACGLVNGQGTVVVTPATGADTLTLANAVLDNVERADWQGIWLNLRYTFKITTIS